MDDRPERGRKRRWLARTFDQKTVSTLMVVLIGVFFYVLLSHFGTVYEKFRAFLDVLTPFIAGFMIAFLLNAPMKFFERKVFPRCRFRRALSVLTVYLLLLIVLSLLIIIVSPQVGKSISTLLGNMDGYLENLAVALRRLVEYFQLESTTLDHLVGSYENILRTLTDFLSTRIPEILNFGKALGSGIITAVTAFISSIYMLLGKDTLVRQIKKLLYAAFPTAACGRFLRVCAEAQQTFVGFINGKIVDSLIIGILCFIFNLILRIPFAVLVAVIVCVTNIIPFFGPIIGAIPCVMILLIIDPWAAVRFVILVVILQQFDGNILGPKILGSSTGLSAIWVLIAIVVGGGLFGFAGMLLGVPTFAVLYSLVRVWADDRLDEKQIDAQGNSLHPEE